MFGKGPWYPLSPSEIILIRGNDCSYITIIQHLKNIIGRLVGKDRIRVEENGFLVLTLLAEINKSVHLVKIAQLGNVVCPFLVDYFVKKIRQRCYGLSFEGIAG